MERQTKTLFGTDGLWAVTNHLWRQLTQPPTVQEQTIPESVPIEEPNSVPVQATQGTRAIQLPVDGDGAIFHRRYRVKIVGSKFMASDLIREVGLRFNQLSPSALAEFEKVKGKPWSLEVGDEFDIVILGPWNGSVRVCEVRPESFCFVTLEGHFERGQITFIVAKNLERGTVTFRITSFSQRGMIRNLFYRFGFWLFGRMLQERFVRESLSRMQLLVQEKLVTGAVQTSSTPVMDVANNPVVHEKLEHISRLN
jgi:Domain of unknown function (DUF1990)